MDRTSDFNVCLKKLEDSPENVYSDAKVKKGQFSLLLSKPGRKGEWVLFTKQIRELVKNMVRMRSLLLENRKDYVNLYSSLLAEASEMTDKERDRFDYDVHVIMKTCTELLTKLRNELTLKAGSRNIQAREHFSVVLDLVEIYLKSVCSIYGELRAIRVKRACERQRLSRLAASFVSGRSVSPPPVSPPRDQNHTNRQFFQEEVEKNTRERRPSYFQETDNSAAQNNALTSEELQMFEEENTQLYDDLNSLTDEVKVLGGKVMEIAKLQEVFMENVLKQENEIDRLNSTVIASTESVREGNDQLREAIKKGAGFRVWVLFFIITLAFTVLFLDWYNP